MFVLNEAAQTEDRSPLPVPSSKQRPCGRYTAWPLPGLSPSAREFRPLSNANADDGLVFRAAALSRGVLEAAQQPFQPGRHRPRVRFKVLLQPFSDLPTDRPAVRRFQIWKRIGGVDRR